MMEIMKYHLKTSKKTKYYYISLAVVNIIVLWLIISADYEINKIFTALSISSLFIYFFYGSTNRQKGRLNSRNNILSLPVGRRKYYNTILLIETLNIFLLIFISFFIAVILNIVKMGNIDFPTFTKSYLIIPYLIISLALVFIFTGSNSENQNGNIILIGLVFAFIYVMPVVVKVINMNLEMIDLNPGESFLLVYLKRNFIKGIVILLSSYLLGSFIFTRKDLS